MIHGIHHVAIHTADLDRLAAFYRAAFGFVPATDEIRWANEPAIDGAIGVPGSAARALMLRAGTCHVELFEYAAPPPREGAPLRPNDRGYTHFCVDVSDIAAEYDRLAALGMRFAQDRPADFGQIKAVYGYDPDGNVIEIQEVAADHDFALGRLTALDTTAA
ncbi:VOC family protein [Sphingomonas profundi]|uniref:VOC family protein n=1 Tax=Alterirhizorhabdus profundi TaxID=2681549 RepID=UPI0012E72D33|nr:VOC family protein [Sphingomonas profundi]